MPRKKPVTSGYARLAQAEEEEEEPVDDFDELGTSRTISDRQYAPIQPGGRSERMDPPSGSGIISPSTPRQSNAFRRRANSGVDIKAINARLEKWAEEITSKLKLRRIKGKTPEEEKLEIHYSVFQAPEGTRPATAETLASAALESAEEKMTKMQFDDVVEGVRVAIEMGIHPKRISQGSSGSYFARNEEGKVVGVFKPKDEEPYASRNPKWTKWIHRNLFPCFFGRACLIPNLSYVSEAAAYVLDNRLQTNIVPYTDIVYFSSPAFHYDMWERRAFYRKRKALPQKVGSLQVFLKGYQDANIFLKRHPWPDQLNPSLASDSPGGSKRPRRWAEDCRPSRYASSDEEDSELHPRPGAAETRRRKSFWTEALQQSFREELEKLVVLDYIMRNTDRGLDNWMIKIDEASQKASLVAEPSRRTVQKESDEPYPRDDEMTMDNNSPSSAGGVPKPNVMLGAIDNSLSWPWKHPDAWRSFPFGWLFLPVSLIGQPFTEKTRNHFLPLLTSKQWWTDTQVTLRQCFSQDSDFKERMFARQIAVMKGQAFNVVETLKTPDHGPLELTRRARVQVWDDLVDIPTVAPNSGPSIDTSRRFEQHTGQTAQDVIPEMDISSAARPSDPQLARNLLNLDSPPTSVPPPQNRAVFLSDNNSINDTLNSPTSASATSDIPYSDDVVRDGRPHAARTQTRMSYDQPRPGGSNRFKRKGRKRNMSFAGRPLYDFYDADEEGDLGYAAARDMEGNRKKVIVERLETVKSKGPVFTWC
ncbi:MAG: phosphatidyl inositol kinase [Alyxoria varia]|nr:MAG: phosphatidyl inositol kinase [Alyxoria varia]